MDGDGTDSIAYIIRVVHRHSDTLALEIEHIKIDNFGTVGGGEHEAKLSRPRNNKISGAVLRQGSEYRIGSSTLTSAVAHLVTKRMTADDNGVDPAWYWAGDALEHDGLAEDGTTQNVADGAIRALPHLLELELLHTRLIGGNGRALDTHAVLENGLGGIDGNLVARLQKDGYQLRLQAAEAYRVTMAVRS